MNERILKNWATVPRTHLTEALKWAKQHNQYITNDYAVIGGRVEHYQKGDDYENIDFFFAGQDTIKEFDKLFGVEK